MAKKNHPPPPQRNSASKNFLNSKNQLKYNKNKKNDLNPPRCPPSAILFYMVSSQKLTRSSEMSSEPSCQIWMRSIQRFIWYSLWLDTKKYGKNDP